MRIFLWEIYVFQIDYFVGLGKIPNITCWPFLKKLLLFNWSKLLKFLMSWRHEMYAVFHKEILWYSTMYMHCYRKMNFKLHMKPLFLWIYWHLTQSPAVWMEIANVTIDSTTLNFTCTLYWIKLACFNNEN